MSLVKNGLQYENFINLLPALERDEVFYVTTVVRKKHLTEEAKASHTGKQIVVHSDYVTDKSQLRTAMERIDALWLCMLRTGEVDLPEYSVSTYLKINPCSMLKAYENFTETVNQHYFNLIGNMMNDTNPDWNVFKSLRGTLIREVSKTTSRRVWIDLDIDNDDLQLAVDLKDSMCAFLAGHDIEPSVLRTRGGFHLLVPKNLVTKQVPLYAKVAELNEKHSDGEVKFNTDGFVPIAGTMQGNHLVGLENL